MYELPARAEMDEAAGQSLAGGDVRKDRMESRPAANGVLFPGMRDCRLPGLESRGGGWEMTMDDDVLTVGHAEAARMCGVGIGTWFSLVSAGKTPAPRKLGRRVLWLKTKLAEWALAGFPCRDRWEARKK